MSFVCARAQRKMHRLGLTSLCALARSASRPPCASVLILLPNRITVSAPVLATRTSAHLTASSSTRMLSSQATTDTEGDSPDWEWRDVLTLAGLAALIVYGELSSSPKRRMTPDGLVSETLLALSEYPHVTRHLGAPLTAIQDSFSGEQTEFVYLADDDASPVLRIQFRIRGSRGTAKVFAQVDERMNEGEFEYLLVEFADDGQVLELIDKRPRSIAW